MASGENEAGLELMDEVGALYDKLAVLTEAFLGAVRGGLPDALSQDAFWQARTSLVEQLQPLLAQQGDWFRQHKAPDQASFRQAAALQTRKMRRLEALDGQLKQQLTAIQVAIGEQLQAIRMGKKGLVGYQVEQKVAPRFCRKTT